MDIDLVTNLLLWGLAFIFSTTFHEASHAWAAKIGGDLTAYHGGQASLDPIPHIRREPVGMVVFPLISFFFNGGNWMMGWASAPYDPYWATRHPKRAALMALAGPASNFLLALICIVALRVGLSADVFESGRYLYPLQGDTPVWDTLAKLLSIMLTLNVVLATFNLIPLPPLDGATGILLFFPEHKAAEVMDKIHRIGMIGLILAWIVYYRVGGYFVVAAWRLVH